jgi:hypothetical protein
MKPSHGEFPLPKHAGQVERTIQGDLDAVARQRVDLLPAASCAAM